jgi:hypothetical protein
MAFIAPVTENLFRESMASIEPVHADALTYELPDAEVGDVFDGLQTSRSSAASRTL